MTDFLWMGVWLLALLLAVTHALLVHRRILRTQPNASISPLTLHGIFLLIAAGFAGIATGSDIVQRFVTWPGLFEGVLLVAVTVLLSVVVVALWRANA